MAQNEQINVVQDTTVVVDAVDGVLANDAGATLVLPLVQLLRTSAGGQIYFDADGSYTYISAPGFSGTDTVQYETDNAGTGTLSINVTATALLPFVSIGTQLSERFPVKHGFGQAGNGVATTTSTATPLSGGGYVVPVSYLDQAFGSIRELRTYDADHNLISVFDPGMPIGTQTIAALPGGGYVFAYLDRDQDAGTQTTHVQLFDANGTSMSGPTLFDVPGPIDTISGLTVQPDGRFVLLQLAIDGDAQLYAQSFSALGVPDGPQFAIGNSDQGRFPTLLPNGDIVVQQIVNDTEVHLQRFDPQGNPIGGEITPTDDGLDIFGIRMIARPEGGFVLHWLSLISPDGPDVNPQFRAHLQVVDAAGNLVGTAATTDLDFTTFFGAPDATSSVTPLVNGGFVVRWRGIVEEGEVADRVQAFDADGNPVGSPIFFGVLTEFGTTRALVFALPEGGFAVGLQAGNPTDHDELLIYDDNGGLVGGVRMHDLGDGTGASSFFLTNLANGDTLILGQTFSFVDNDFPEPQENDNWIQTIRFDTPTPVIEADQTGGTTPYSGVVLPVRVSIPADSDGSEIVESLVVSGVPAGWTLSHANATATLTAGVWTVTGPGIAKGGAIDLHVTAPVGTPGSGTLSVVAHTLDTDNGSRNQSFPAPYDFANLPPLTPEIVSNGGGDGAVVPVAENLAAVATVVATDLDHPPAYAIAGGADAALFAIDAATGALIFKAAPDFEAPKDAGGDNVYEVVVAASYGGPADTQTILVTVGNVDGVTITGTKGKDKVTASKTVKGEPLPTGEEDVIGGRGGNDRLFGLGGNDEIKGGAGRDTVAGGAGDDLLSGGVGRDKYVGGPGLDSYVFDTQLIPRSLFDHLSMAAVKKRVDTIADYEKGEQIILDSDVFKGLSKGPLAADQFHIGKEAAAPTHRVVYDESRGLLIFDRNGSAVAGDVAFCRIGKNIGHLDHNDIMVI
jgi:Ca2+-binding RTX toxin-like protein